MSAYRQRRTRKGSQVVDAVRAPEGIIVKCGPRRSCVAVTTRGQWIVLTPNSGYEVWPHSAFVQEYCRAEVESGRRRKDRQKLADALRTCGLERVRGMALERCA